MLWGFRRRQLVLFNTITEWIKGGHTQQQVVLMISVMVGVCTGLTAFILKWIIKEIQLLLTSGVEEYQANWQFLVYPAVGILITMLFVASPSDWK